MASAVQEITLSLDEEPEYSQKLHKAIQNHFVSNIHPIPLQECTSISNLLTDEEMQNVTARNSADGQSSSARLLLSILKTKPNWFDALLVALDNEHLKLREFREKYFMEKKKVDEEWLKQKSRRSQGERPNIYHPSMTGLGSSTQSSEGQLVSDLPPGIGADGNRVWNDFDLPSPTTVANPEDFGGMQIDADEEREEPPESTSPLPTQPGGTSEAAAEAEPSRNLYATLNVGTENPYDQLEQTERKNNCILLQTDACPMPIQPSEEMPEEVPGFQAEPEINLILQPPPPPQPQRREDHPSLRVAISNNPVKDFDAAFVQEQMSELRGWCPLQQEHEVIQIIRPQRRTEGSYVLWFWDLAKRPTICVILRRKVITFVVHKSTSEPRKYYINRRQKKMTNLKELLEYHVANGIRYTPPEHEDSLEVRLTRPVP